MLIREMLRFDKFYRLLVSHIIFEALLLTFQGRSLSTIFFNEGLLKNQHQEVDVCQICQNFLKKRIAFDISSRKK